MKLIHGQRTWRRRYIEFVQSGGVRNFLHDPRHVEDFQEETEDDWDDAQNEVFLAELLKYYMAEAATYNALRDHQGSLIPRLFAEVNLDLTPPNAHDEGIQPEELFQVKGILIQYIEGFTLSALPDHAPQSSWQNIVDQAVSIVHVLGDNNIMNQDVRPDNFMISLKGNGRYQVFMIDFGLCRFRGQDESYLDWGGAKYTESEVDAAGLFMQRRLGKHGFELKYECSQRYIDRTGRDEERSRIEESLLQP